MDKNKFLEELSKLGISLTNNQKNQLHTYYKMLIETNENINLTTITKEEDVYLKHFYDSLTLIKAYDLTKNIKVCDIGTGAGFPGLVLKIVFPNLDVTLVDSLEKRTKFLKEVIEQLKLENIKVIAERIEKYANIAKEEYDIITSRAVAKTNILLELSSQLVKVNGYALFMKAEIEEELINAKQAIALLNFKLEEKIKFKLPIENSTRTIIKLKKISKTSSKYPRDFAQIKKKPL